ALSEALRGLIWLSDRGECSGPLEQTPRNQHTQTTHATTITTTANPIANVIITATTTTAAHHAKPNITIRTTPIS
ncbi:hypothetical protein, partial [Bifidobacterium coryneforme]|uniref:hypothetical protein n=1 Tax=Bifidobacterium coryneforme TaxID=1687 RepID=UPI000529C2AD